MIMGLSTIRYTQENVHSIFCLRVKEISEVSFTQSIMCVKMCFQFNKKLAQHEASLRTYTYLQNNAEK